jgi:hypothetical protein
LEGGNFLNNKVFLKMAERQFFLPFSMLEKVIEKCPENLWNEKKSGYIFWQQILHALTGIGFWFRLTNEKFIEPFYEKKVYPELEKDAETNLLKEEIVDYKNEVKRLCEEFFCGKDDAWLNEDSILFSKIKNIDVVMMQIRHVQYHVGYCNSIFKENGVEPVEWIDYFGEGE